MDAIDGVFDGERLLLRNKSEIPLEEIKRGRIEYHPYLLFPVKTEDETGELEEDDTSFLYPHTVDRELDKGTMVYGETRPTRILHYIPFGECHIIRKPDLRYPHTVRTLGYRELIIEKNDGTELRVSFDGNCYHIPPNVESFVNGKETIELEEFYDRPSEFANIMKKAGIEIYSK